ncbi:MULTISPECIES: cytochrome P460 family protein [unclassified Paraburkholderia]|uniref:cytochrome P460 family protein n=1 Tax=unclassified Paraburkholderia TaxID=2615204 RepID=UPI0020B66719|nr:MULTISPECIES: cytochrome P460 family protein [unclassified Paraburkholderia]MCP3719299.1 cytochrome P460 family protein [Paraburkholderia sp. CNPSo 3281]MCX5543902.1 cytochrome P460 family protein [Paraburkholderia sp. CNPSo 3076]
MQARFFGHRALLAQGPAAWAQQGAQAPGQTVSPIYGVTIPPGYRKWEMIAPAEEAQHQPCFACHASKVKDRDYVFTRFAP